LLKEIEVDRDGSVWRVESQLLLSAVETPPTPACPANLQECCYQMGRLDAQSWRAALRRLQYRREI
jgi:hypothetical protein